MSSITGVSIVDLISSYESVRIRANFTSWGCTQRALVSMYYVLKTQIHEDNLFIFIEV